MKPRLEVILALIHELEQGLSGLKLQVQRLAEEDGEKEHTFADLHGILEGIHSSSEAEIDAALYRMTPEFEDEIATLPKAEPRLAARSSQ